jgi:thymidylate synthase, flavin-dependent
MKMKFCSNEAKLLNCNVFGNAGLVPAEDLPKRIAQYIERIARNGTDSVGRENAFTDSQAFCRKMWFVKPRHQSPFEFVTFTFELETSIAVSREIMRHRLCSFNERSTRYCDTSNLCVLKPFWYDNATEVQKALYTNALTQAEDDYKYLIDNGSKRQEARGVLPLDTMTRIIMQANIAEWMHIFELRCGNGAHPDMIDLMCKVRDIFKAYVPFVFEEGKDE